MSDHRVGRSNWWNAPGYAEARGRLFDLMDLVPRPDPGDTGSTWWEVVASFADAGNRARDMSETDLGELRHNTPDANAEAVAVLGGLVRALRETRSAGEDSLDDERVPVLAALLLRMFSAEPFPELLIQLGWPYVQLIPDDQRPDPATFGRLWLADMQDAAWAVFRVYQAASVRGA